MECMKCAQEVEAGEVFCASCLADMEQYPVKTDTVIQLPHQREADSAKKAPPRRRTLSDQERIQRLSLQGRILRWCLLVTVVTTCLLALGIGVLMQELQKQESKQNIGKNYSTVETGPGSTSYTVGR